MLQVLETMISHVAMAKFGMPRSLEEMKNDFANLTATFLLLPLPDQKKIYLTFKGLGESTQAHHSEREFLGSIKSVMPI